MEEGKTAAKATTATSKGGGCGSMLLFIFLLIMATIFGGNFILGSYGKYCGGLSLFDCISEITSEEEELANDVVTASGPYSYKGYSITMTANIPLEGGEVTGTVTGDCKGRVTGTYDGEQIITGELDGSCSVFFVNVPASATFNGIVDEESNTAPISFEGSGGGFSHSGSLTLTY